MDNLSVLLGVNADYHQGWAEIRFKNLSGGSEIFSLQLQPQSGVSWSTVAECVESLARELRNVTLRPSDYFEPRERIADFMLQERLPQLLAQNFAGLDWRVKDRFFGTPLDWY